MPWVLCPGYGGSEKETKIKPSEFLVDTEGAAIILPVTQDITRLKGMIQAKRPVSIEEMNLAIEQERGRQ